MMRRTIATRIRYYREADAEPDVNIAIQPTGGAKERGRTTDPIAWRDEGEPAAARNARVAKTLTLAAMSLGYVVVQLDVTIVNVAINCVGADFGGSVADLQWIVMLTLSHLRHSS